MDSPSPSARAGLEAFPTPPWAATHPDNDMLTHCLAGDGTASSCPSMRSRCPCTRRRRHQASRITVPTDTRGRRPGDYQATVQARGSGISNSVRPATSTVTLTGAASAESLAGRYDTDENHTSDRGKALAGVANYFSAAISPGRALTLMGLTSPAGSSHSRRATGGTGAARARRTGPRRLPTSPPPLSSL